ncbi:MAG TPA: hypothetical protein VGG24_16860 [Paraburkholderia sp.]|jgi:hypothetical protein
MIHKMTMTLQAAGFGAGSTRDTAARSGLTLARLSGALRRAIGFAITASGFAVIAVHVLQHIGG